MVSFRLRTSHGRAYDSHHRTAGIAGCTRRRGGRVATCGAGAAASKVADHWHFWGGHSFSLESVDRQLCTTTARTWVDRGTHYCDRVSLGRWTKRALRRDRSRVRPAEGRCHRYGAKSGARIKAGDVDYPDLAGKRLELLRELSPGLRRLAILANIGFPAAVLEMGQVVAAARTLGLDV